MTGFMRISALRSQSALMLILRRLATGLVVSATGCVAAPAPSPSSASSAPETIDFTGTWRAERILGPRILGSLMIRRVDGRLVAEAGGLTGTGGLSGRRVKFEWPNGARFEGRTTDEKGPIRGHWFQAPSRFDGNVFATPITLRRIGDGWRGELRPLRDDVHFRLRLGSPAEGRSADLFNRERNLGVFQKLTRWTAERTKLSLWGSFRGRGPEQILLTGRFHPEEGILNLRYPYRGGGYEFRRVEASPAASPVAWPLQAPAELGDGWPVADPASVGIDVAPIAAMVTARILRERTSVHDLAVHAMLIARRGRLVVERYFRGYDRDRPHDSRSASKTVAAVLAAAASQAGLNVGWDTPVYATLEDRRPPRRADIRLRHLVNMSSGLDCDDRDPKSAANEDSLWETAKDGDFYRHTLAVRVVHPPGKHPAYCSASSHLAAGVVAAAAQRPLLELLDDLLMRPLGIHHYGVPMSPVGRPVSRRRVPIPSSGFSSVPPADAQRWYVGFPTTRVGDRCANDADARRAGRRAGVRLPMVDADLSVSRSTGRRALHGGQWRADRHAGARPRARDRVSSRQLQRPYDAGHPEPLDSGVHSAGGATVAVPVVFATRSLGNHGSDNACAR